MGKKPSMTDVVETAFNVPFKNPLRRIVPRQKIETLFDGVCGRAAFSEVGYPDKCGGDINRCISSYSKDK
jgi:hypothetical protein